MLRKLARELIEIDCLEIRVGICVAESGFRNEIYDIVVIVDCDHRPIHPGLVSGYECKVRIGIIHQQLKHFGVENQVALQ